jgi:hypothetical protein
MSELMLRVLGLKSYVEGGEAMAKRLNESGVKKIYVVGRGGLVVHGQSDKLNVLRKAAKQFVEQDKKDIADAK